MSTQNSHLTIANLPAIGTDLDGGTFAGLTTRQDGTHHAVILLPEHGTRIEWKQALTWANKQGGELPTRPVASLLFANVKDKLQPGWHWTSEEDDASYAWYCNFGNGYIHLNHKSYEGSAVAVRLIPLTA
jgi:hypothetical protein